MTPPPSIENVTAPSAATRTNSVEDASPPKSSYEKSDLLSTKKITNAPNLAKVQYLQLTPKNEFGFLTFALATGGAVAIGILCPHRLSHQ